MTKKEYKAKQHAERFVLFSTRYAAYLVANPRPVRTAVFTVEPFKTVIKS